MNPISTYEEHCAARGLIAPKGLTELLKTRIANSLDGLLYRPDVSASKTTSLSWALDLLNDSAIAPPSNLLPLLPVDDASIACAVCSPVDEPKSNNGRVIRWHLNVIPPGFQAALLDIDAKTYLRSVDEELYERKKDLPRMKKIAAQYQRKYVSAGRRPPGWETRPVQLACQNVIIGLSTFAHDSTIDGLRVEIYLTCEVPHLATHEANRAMSALMLCDAFQNGGTMEIRFGSRRSKRIVPPGLRRFGRSLGLSLGSEDALAITPSEARDLFLAVTPMPDELRARAFDLMDRGLISPERLCYTLLSPVWRAIELDYIIATSSRVVSILEGGASPTLRRARLAELEVARAALMTGMLFRRLNGDDAAGSSNNEVRVFEDSSVGVEWTVNGTEGSVTFAAVPPGKAPWSAPTRTPITIGDNGFLRVVPRALTTPADYKLVLDLAEESPQIVTVLLVPADMADTVPAQVPVLHCPDRLSELDIEIERKLQNSRVGRS